MNDDYDLGELPQGVPMTQQANIEEEPHFEERDADQEQPSQIALQYKSIFSQDAMQELQNRLRSKEAAQDGIAYGDDDLRDIHVHSLSDQSGNSDGIKFYGDQLYFEYKYLYDKAMKKGTFDSRFQGKADVSTCLYYQSFRV